MATRRMAVPPGIRLLRLAAAIVVFVVAWTPGYAHHSTGANYDNSDSVRIRGTLVSLDWVNPHVFMVFDAAIEGGPVQRWTVEAQSPSRLRQWDAEFEIGLQYQVRLSPARTGGPAGFLRAVLMPDGRAICPANRPTNAERNRDCDV